MITLLVLFAVTFAIGIALVAYNIWRIFGDVSSGKFDFFSLAKRTILIHFISAVMTLVGGMGTVILGIYLLFSNHQ